MWQFPVGRIYDCHRKLCDFRVFWTRGFCYLGIHGPRLWDFGGDSCQGMGNFLIFYISVDFPWSDFLKMICLDGKELYCLSIIFVPRYGENNKMCPIPALVKGWSRLGVHCLPQGGVPNASWRGCVLLSLLFHAHHYLLGLRFRGVRDGHVSSHGSGKVFFSIVIITLKGHQKRPWTFRQVQMK